VTHCAISAHYLQALCVRFALAEQDKRSRNPDMWPHLKSWRRASGLTLEAVAYKMRTSHSTLLRWESGVHKVPPGKIIELARIYNCTPAELEFPPEEREMAQRLDRAARLLRAMEPEDAKRWLDIGGSLAKNEK
jgi:transcriptional regulator with XRE-family HTH domain